LRSNFDGCADISFNLHGTTSGYLHGIGGHTVVKLRVFDLAVVQCVAPHIVILEKRLELMILWVSVSRLLVPILQSYSVCFG